MIVYIDTQIALWLFSGKLKKLSVQAKKLIDRERLLMSPIVLTEIALLNEVGRCSVDPLPLYTYLHTTIGLTLCTLPFSLVATASIAISWTRDPFDRLIVAQASVPEEAKLLTSDGHILEHFTRAVW